MLSPKSWALMVTLAAAPLLTGCEPPRQAETPSGLPVPRYVSLSKGEVNARSGPSEDNRLVAVYRARGLPVQIVAETDDWRRVCDPEGGLVWINKRLVDGKRNVIRIQSGPAEIHSRPSASASIAGWLPPKGLAALDKCDKGWCKVQTGAAKGWIAEADVWGTAPQPQCHG